ncbi:DctP family TRAP transporter solute-binding subunit [Sedimentibacter hydroxybenzoicus DSM 7310]|uniref:DctP family TRAP transporter solute-binding subunit n=1 Tax=Sedimentibacter hydroxybenzoicus DSM 7310 TaxID=1123245 RepID=A0A974BH06_SEDHY|nr:DctP family TRAP transporter solute-binding subunit [Sedimentibacter hydroxybenzoicus]NYB72766.1 DctP family TRAP transporter solute-binding subunit [Sedimentibacter hydroxybenzoicus DSM 7310]
MKKKLALILVIALCLGLFVGCSSKGANAPKEEVLEIKVGHGVAETTAMHQGWLKFKELVEQKSDGKIIVKIFPNQQLGGDRELVEAVQLGNVTMTSPSTAPLAAFDPAFFVLDIPFLFSDRDMVYEVLDSQVGQSLLDTLKEYNIKGLGYWENGFRNFTNSKLPVRSPQELSGIKVRTMENEIHMKAWSLLGANPTPMAFGELYTALQQKTVDAQENPFELIYATKFQEVQKYITKTQHIYSAYIPLMNNEFFNNLSTEYQEIIMDSIKEATAEQRQIAGKNDVEFEEKMRSTNEVIDLSSDEKQAFRNEMAPVLDLVKTKAGEDMVSAFTEATGY